MKIVEQRTIELLKTLGLTEYEAHAYAILAFVDALTAVEVADLTKIPRPRIYDILKKLDRRGFIHVQQGKPTTYTAIPPSELVDIITRELGETMKVVMDRGDELIQTIEPLYKRMILPKELSWAIKGKENIRKQLRIMLDSAKRVSVITSYSNSILLKDKVLLKRLSKLKARVITDGEKVGIETPGLEWKMHPVRERFAMLIADERECLIATIEGDSLYYNAGILIVNQAISANFEQYFDFLWKSI